MIEEKITEEELLRHRAFEELIKVAKELGKKDLLLEIFEFIHNEQHSRNDKSLRAFIFSLTKR